MLAGGVWGREPCWSEAVTVGSEAFVANVKTALGLADRYRAASPAAEVNGYAWREPGVAYRPHSGHETGALTPENTKS
jgi:hypothetical protein